MSKFRYQPEIQDVLRKQMPPSVVQQLLRRDHSLEDYLAALPAPTTGGTGALAAKRDIYTGFATVASDASLSSGALVWAPSSPLDGGIAADFSVSVAGLYLFELIAGYDPNPTGIRRTQLGAGYGSVDSGLMKAVVPGLGANMLVCTSGSIWLDAGDFINVYTAQDSGGPLDVSAQLFVTQIVVA